MSVVVLEHYRHKSPIFGFTLSALIGIYFPLVGPLGLGGPLCPYGFINSQSFESTYIVPLQSHSFQYSLILLIFSLTSQISKFQSLRSTAFRFEVWFRLTRIVGGEVVAFLSISCNKSQNWIQNWSPNQRITKWVLVKRMSNSSRNCRYWAFYTIRFTNSSL